MRIVGELGIGLGARPWLAAADAWATSNSEPPWWIAIVVAFVALAGTLSAQIVSIVVESRKRRDEQTRLARSEVEKLMKTFFDFAEFARTVPGAKSISKACRPFDTEWNRHAGPLAVQAAYMAGSRHRDAALTLMDGLGLQDRAYRDGESVGATPRAGYVQMAWAGFEVVAAWLRGERLPRHAAKWVRDARRMRAYLDAEARDMWRSSDPHYKPGVLTRFGQWSLARWRRIVLWPARRFWKFLFAN